MEKQHKALHMHSKFNQQRHSVPRECINSRVALSFQISMNVPGDLSVKSKFCMAMDSRHAIYNKNFNVTAVFQTVNEFYQK